MTMGTVKIYNASDEFTAVSLRDMLQQAGIPAMIQSNEVPGFGQMFTAGVRVGFGDILVNEEDEEKARELIGGFLGKLGELAELDEDDDLEDWDPEYPLSEDELEERDEI